MPKPEVVNTASSFAPIFLSLVTIAVTWVGSIILFSIQHRKSVQNKWLDTFRNQMADLIVTANRITPGSNKEELGAFSKAFFTIQFLLDGNNTLHMQLLGALDEFQKYAFSVTNANFNSSEYTRKCSVVVAIFRQIMKEEHNKMKRLF